MLDNGKPLWSMSGLPLALCYIFFPGLIMITGMGHAQGMRSWIDVAWLILAALALFRIGIRLPLPVACPRVPGAWFIVGPICLLLVAAELLGGKMIPFTFTMELKPLIYALTALAWVAAFGLPSRRAYIQAGICLSSFILAEFLVSSIRNRALVHPRGSGEVNYDACLIVLSFCMALSGKRCRKHAIYLFIGVACTMSRTGAMAALAILLLSRTVPLKGKITGVGLSAAASLASFLTRGLELDVTQVDRYLMWTSAIGLFTTNPSRLPFGYGIGASLPASIPQGLLDLWQYESANISQVGVFAFQFHAMWLRLMITWGAVTTALFLIALCVWICQRRSVLARYVAVVILLEGFTMGVFYLSNVGVPLFLMVFIATFELERRKDVADAYAVTIPALVCHP